MRDLDDQLFRKFGRVQTRLYRLTDGLVGDMGGTVLLLTTTGRRSGERRTSPLIFRHYGDNAVFVVASNRGGDRHPAWFLNLRDLPEVEVQIGGRKTRRLARIAEGEERARLYEEFALMDAQYRGYQEMTEREIPVVILERIGPVARA